MVRLKLASIRKDERGFTLPELLTTIAILGILIAIAVSMWLGLLERRKVDAAANQLASDMRLAHARATNQLTDWRLVLAPGRGDEDTGADYYLIRLNGVYKSGSPTPTVAESIPRTLPDNVRVANESTLNDDQTATWWVAPSSPAPDPTRTLEFNSDGTMLAYAGPSGTVKVTVDGDPERSITFLAATSRVKIAP
jgi:prepilin-type N-terminal cleavage/methylation domain-containing protein